MDTPENEVEKIDRLREAMYSRTLSQKIKDKPRRALDDPESLVGEDWIQPETKIAGLVVAPRLIGATRSLLWWLLIGSVLFFLAAVGFFIYFFLFGAGSLPAAPGNIDISVSGPPQVSSGEPAELQVVVINRNKVPLELTDLLVTYPPGTRSPTDFSTDLPNTRIPLGTIEPGGQRQGTISAVFAGTEGQKGTVKLELEYHVAGSSAIFVASSEYTLSYSSSPLSVAIDGNTETVSGQPVQFTVNVRSNTNAPLKDVLLKIDYPFGFKFTNAAPKASGDNLWSLGDFAPGQKKSVLIQGTLTGERGDQRVFHFAAGTRKAASTAKIDTKLADNTFQMNIAQAFLGLTIVVNKENSTNTIVSPGENVIVNITYQNNLSTAINDAVIVARLSGIDVDGTSVHTTDGFYRSTDNAMLWDRSTTNGALTELAPGAKGTVSFTFQMPSSEDLKNISDPSLLISVNAAGKRLAEAGVPQNLQSTALKKVQLATDLQLSAQGLYYGNPFGSSGPMPPKAGTETTYALVFTVTNTTNKIVNASMSARLPPYVRWVGIFSPSTEKLTFDQINGTVTWNIGTIEAGAGLNGKPPRQSAIAIGFTPSTSQIGQSPPLLRNITLSGTDAATEAAIVRTAADVTTNILGDPGFTPANATVVK